METRNDKWAIEQLLAGKKVREPSWWQNEFIHLVDGVIKDEEGLQCWLYSVDQINSEWELYEEPLPVCRFCGNQPVQYIFSSDHFKIHCPTGIGCLVVYGQTKEQAEQRWREINREKK